MVEYQAQIDEDETEPNLYNVEIEDTFNPFGNRAVLYIKDDGGERYEKYERGTRVDISYKEFTNFNGYDTLTVESGETFSVSSGTTENYETVLNAGEVLNGGTIQTGVESDTDTT